MKEKVDLIVNKVKQDKDFFKKFKADPVQAVQSIIGADLPTSQLNQIVEGVKAKITVDDAKGLLGKAKGFFNK